MNSTAHQEVAAEVRAQLARKRRSARSVALEIGWNQGYISRRITGETPFTINDLVEIARVLEVPVTSFFQELAPGQLRKQLTPSARPYALAAAA